MTSCTCGRRHGGTGTVLRSAICSSPTTYGTRSCVARRCRSCTTSAARTPRTRDALQRLVASVTRFLDPDAAPAATADGLEFTGSRPLGGAWALDALWSRLGIGQVMRKLLKGRRLDDSAERVLFALVANRALAPSSELAAARWASEDVLITGLPVTSDDACYRAMGRLLEIKDELERKVFDDLARLLNLEVDLLFFDTTSTYFVTEDDDEPVVRDKNGNPLTGASMDGDDGERPEPGGFRARGKSRDSRDDLPQIVIGMAVTRDGIPVRVWCWAGDTNDSALIRQARDDMRDWCLSKVIWVADRGFTSAAAITAVPGYVAVRRHLRQPEPGPQSRDVRFIPVSGQDEQRLPVAAQAAGVLPGADLPAAPGQQPRNEQDQVPGHIESDTIGDQGEAARQADFFGETSSTGSSASPPRCPPVSARLPAWALCDV